MSITCWYDWLMLWLQTAVRLVVTGGFTVALPVTDVGATDTAAVGTPVRVGRTVGTCIQAYRTVNIKPVAVKRIFILLYEYIMFIIISFIVHHVMVRQIFIVLYIMFAVEQIFLWLYIIFAIKQILFLLYIMFAVKQIVLMLCIMFAVKLMFLVLHIMLAVKRIFHMLKHHEYPW